MTDIYAASEQPIPGITAEALVAAIRDAGHKHVVYRSSMQDGIDYLLKEARPGDAILTIGAGNVGRADRRNGDSAGREGFHWPDGMSRFEMN